MMEAGDDDAILEDKRRVDVAGRIHERASKGRDGVVNAKKANPGADRALKWVKGAAKGVRRSFNIRKGFKAVGLPEFAHRPQRFKKKRGYFFMDQSAVNFKLCEALPLPV